MWKNMWKKVCSILFVSLLIPAWLFAATASHVVFFSTSPFGTGDIKTGSPNMTITNGVATLDTAQTGNIGAGDCIEFTPVAATVKVYIAPCRIAFTSGSVEPEINSKLKGETSEAHGIVRAVEVISGSWAGGNAAGYIYFSRIDGTFNSSEKLNRIKPTGSANIAETNGNLQGDMSRNFVVKMPDGTEATNIASIGVDSIHHEYASLSAFEAGFTDADHINTTDLVSNYIQAHCCAYYDHDDQTLDTTALSIDGFYATVGRCLYIYTPQGNQESINDQRHDGKWNGNKYILQVTGDGVHAVDINEIGTIFEGFQINMDGSKNAYGIYVHGNGIFTSISYNIIKGTFSGGNTNCTGIYITTSSVYIWNNIVYDFINGTKTFNGIDIHAAVSAAYIYDNTVYNCYTAGINRYDGVVYIKNNIVNDCGVECYSGSFDTSSTHNIGNGTAYELRWSQTYKTGQADTTAASKLVDSDAQFITNGVVIGCVIKNTTDTTYTYVTALDSEGQLSINDDIFVSGENYEVYTNKIGNVTFNNEAGDDFHLGSSDTLAIDLGYDLSSDIYLPIWDDIDNYERSIYGSGWDIGADEYQESESEYDIIWLEITKHYSCEWCNILYTYCPESEKIINCYTTPLGGKGATKNLTVSLEFLPGFDCNACDTLWAYCLNPENIIDCYVL